MNVTLQDLTPEDAQWVCAHFPAAEIEVFMALSDGSYIASEVAAIISKATGLCWAFVSGIGVTIAVGGFSRVAPGVLRTWFFAIHDAWSRHNAPGLTDLVRSVIRDTLAAKLAHRIETVTLASQSRARAWYEKIGLSYESTLRGYCVNGADAVLYVALARDAEKG